MNRVSAVLGSALFLILAPGVVAGFVPWWISGWEVQPLLGFRFIRVVGVLVIAVSILALLESFARFALQGLGTPAPILPIVLVILGQAMILGNVSLLAYGALVWLICHLFVLAYEEPTLRRTFGPEYDAFCANVPRWIPRLRPWSGSTRPH